MELKMASSVALAASHRGSDGEAGSAGEVRQMREWAGSWAGAGGAGVCVRIRSVVAETGWVGEAGHSGGQRET